jgi:hypothetical protein
MKGELDVRNHHLSEAEGMRRAVREDAKESVRKVHLEG